MPPNQPTPAPEAPVVVAEDLGKRYRVFPRPLDRLKQALARGRRTYYEELWALSGVSFAVPAGAAVGIVGENGAGKSTLLALLARILEPTTGSVRIRGAVAPLLELGTGFNPELSGEENLRLYAVVSGLDSDEVDRRRDAIVEFSGLGDAIHRPLRTFSSGMVLRLAFSVAANVDPDVLIVDEALAVGDEAFQRKCYGRIEELTERGTTLFVASHDPSVILSLCDRALLLDRGELLHFGGAREVVTTYQKLLFSAPEERESLRAEIRAGEVGETVGPPERRPPTDTPTFDPGLVPEVMVPYRTRGAILESPEVRDRRGQRVNLLDRGASYTYSYRVRFLEPQRRVRFGMMIKTKTGFELAGGVSAPPEQAVPRVEAGTTAEVSFRFTCRLLPGVYYLNAGVVAWVGGEETYLHRLVDAAMIRVRAEAGSRATCVVDLDVDGTVALVEEPSSSPSSSGSASPSSSSGPSSAGTGMVSTAPGASTSSGTSSSAPDLPRSIE